MNKTSTSQSTFLNLRILAILVFVAGIFAALLLGFGTFSEVLAQVKEKEQNVQQNSNPLGERPKFRIQTNQTGQLQEPSAPQTIVLAETFDGVTPPALPSGWTADQGTNAGGFPLWVTSNSGTPAPPAMSAPNAAFTVDPSNILDNRLVSPTLTYPAGAQLTFRQNYDLEQENATTAYDCGVLEMKIGAADWQDILTAGGTFVAGGYNHSTLSTAFINPLLPSRPNWSGISNGGAGGFETCTVNLPAAAAGQPVQFRWRMGSDNSVSHAGWRVDSVQIIAGARITAGTATLQSEGCSPSNGVIDPSETVTVSFCAQNTGTANATNLVGTLQATGGVTNPSGPQTYGVVTAGGAAVCRSFTFTASPSLQCGATLVATIHFQDGSNNEGDLTFSFPLGVSSPGISEGFNDITTLVGAGWFMQNNSEPVGTTGWFQGNTTTFSAQAGAANSYIGANYNNTGDTGTISNWLLTPPVTVQNGAQLIFWTRTVDSPMFPDRLQVRMSTNGSSTNVGSTSTSVGDFTNLLLDINPTYTASGYPNTWTQFTVNITGVASPTTGRLAFRYFVENAGFAGLNSDFIGIDTVSYMGSPPACCASGAPQPSSAVSRKTHPGAGTFDVALPLSGTPGIECRTGGSTNDYTMVVTFGSPVTVNGTPQAQAISGTCTIGTGGVSNGGMVTISGNNVTVPLTNVTNAQTLQVRLNNVTGTSGSGNVTIPMSVLIGDTNANAAVNSGDVSQTKARLGAVLDTTNFRSDVNANGAINAGDVSQIKSLLGTGLP